MPTIRFGAHLGQHKLDDATLCTTWRALNDAEALMAGLAAARSTIQA